MTYQAFCLKKQQGFSLIEILVVVVIISLFSAAVVMSFNPNNTASELRQESLRLQRVISIALDEAQIQGAELGLVITDEGYQFLVLNERIWQPISDDKAFDIHYWPKNTEIFLELEGLQSNSQQRQQQFTLSNNFSDKLSRDRDRDSANTDDDFSFTLEDQQQQDESVKTTPQIYLLSSGETTPFELVIMKPEDEREVYYQITANYVGAVNIDGPFKEKPSNDFENE